ncbi:MAG: NTP transferase domain-containing protein [Polyangiaceae bacterium]
MQLAAVVLAAGMGRRMGGPKALLAWPTLPERWVLPLAAAHVEARRDCASVVVVTRPAIAEVLRRVAPDSFAPPGRGRLCLSAAPDEQGPAGSLAAYAASGPITADAVVVTPVDLPPIAPEVVLTLATALEAHPEALAAKPRHAGRGGHPVLLRPAVLAGHRAPEGGPHPDPPTLREVLVGLRDAGQLVEVEVDDPGVLLNLDRAEDLRAWARRHAGGEGEEPSFFE